MGRPTTRLPVMAAITAIICASLAAPSFSEIEKPKISGSYYHLFNTSETISSKKPYVSYLQRFRFQLEEKFSDKLSATIVQDVNFLLNDFSTSADFNIVRDYNQRQLQYWNTQQTILNKRDLYWTESLYRAYVRYDTPLLKCVIGKQNIDWDRMRFYHPLDIFNPVSPLRIEKTEKMGVDAVNIEFCPAPFMSYNFIYAPDDQTEFQSFGMRFATKVKDYDIFLMAADIRKAYYFGFAFDGYLKESGLRGEITYTSNHNYDDKVIDNGNYNDGPDRAFRGSIGMDRSFTSKLYGIIEYFYNGIAKIMNAPLFISSLQYSRRALSITKHILSAGLEYQHTGITKLNNYVFYDFEGNSFFYNPEFVWNIKPNVDLMIGCQIFEGNDNSEYGNYHNLFYAEMKIYF